ncbi:MAG: hypothetical protein JSW50_08800 [Candidatus Latescibacterota bacterium]|nr:MAG: hypothetical protein JSW50_08800 [Candidatus Latescibacterota bacterium]
MTSDTGGQQKNNDNTPTVKFRRRPIPKQKVSPGLLILATALLIAIILVLRWVSQQG